MVLRSRWAWRGRGFSIEQVDQSSSEEELGFRRRHGLFWLVVNLARETPLVVLVDDAQWADEPSAAFVRHLATRLEKVPVLLAISSRPHPGPLSGMIAEPGARVIRPAPLSVGAVGGWVSESLEEEADARFVAAFHSATGGNPFMVSELVREVASEGLAPRGDSVDRLRGLSPAGRDHDRAVAPGGAAARVRPGGPRGGGAGTG